MNGPTPKDLIALAADKNIEFTLRGILSRPASLRTRQIASDIFVHPEKDPGCLLRSHEFLRPFLRQYTHSIVLFDRDGCGQDGRTRIELESGVQHDLAQSGWGDRAVAVVIDPELEAWVWSDSPHVDGILGWAGKQPTLRQWLHASGFLSADEVKPREPKRALEEALRLAAKPRSSSIYARLAAKVSFDRCLDPSFLKLRATLTGWFGA